MLALFLLQHWDEQTSILNISIDFEKGKKVELARDVIIMQQRLIAAGFMMLEATPPVLALQPVAVVGERCRRPGMTLENELVVLNPELRAVTLEALKDPALLDSGVLPALVPIPANDPAPITVTYLSSLRSQNICDHPFSSFISRILCSHRQGSTLMPYYQSTRTKRIVRNNR
ncbi:hypothetical protein PS15p_211441 [Mucor circinelloides]